MKLSLPLLIMLVCLMSCRKETNNQDSPRQVIVLNTGWTFQKGEHPEAIHSSFDDSNWENVTVPHDWAIFGPFDKEIDRQVIAITQNNETQYVRSSKNRKQQKRNTTRTKQ